MRQIEKKIRQRMIRTIAAAMLAGVFLTGCGGNYAGGNHTRKGLKALEKGEPEKALEYIADGIDRGEDLLMAYRAQGIAQLALARYEESAAALEKSLEYADEKMPETVQDIRLYLALACYRAEHFNDTVEVCSQILELDQSVTEAWFLSGAARLGLGDQEGAGADFDRAIALEKSNYHLYLRIYEAYEGVNLTAVGDEYLQTSLNILPETTQDCYEVSQIYYYLQQYDKARDMLMKPVEEKYVPAIALMGQVYLAVDDYAHAGAMYQLIYEQEGETPIVDNGFALCALAAGDYDDALNYINKGLALDEEEGKQQLRFNEITAYERKLDFSTALVKAEAYNALYPGDEAGIRELKFLRTRN